MNINLMTYNRTSCARIVALPHVCMAKRGTRAGKYSDAIHASSYLLPWVVARSPCKAYTNTALEREIGPKSRTHIHWCVPMDEGIARSELLVPFSFLLPAEPKVTMAIDEEMLVVEPKQVEERMEQDDDTPADPTTASRPQYKPLPASEMEVRACAMRERQGLGKKRRG